MDRIEKLLMDVMRGIVDQDMEEDITEVVLRHAVQDGTVVQEEVQGEE